MDYDKLYKEMRKEYTVEEIAESMLFPGKKPTPEEHKEFVRHRMELWHKTTPQQRMLGRLLGLKYRLEAYVESRETDSTKTAHFLKQYIDITEKKQKEVADDLSINPSTLSRILNSKENVGRSLAYRLERHSGNLIPAIYWWKLAQKEIEQDIRTNVVDREKEAKMVKNVIYKESA